ncbi:BnaC05g19930D [Brassica napus]|uniref:(rape) hypothetical protein n=1 Tax=Brassica napus TaxID=3708 RepID=A0A078FNM3_BRANA|nr:unnamed protein product [Brassica napus]CDY14736.1 BnaC05g19930D [Brassica napus]
MATPADSRDVKSLNNSEGTNKFSFKNVGEKMEDTKMEKVRAEASEGSTFIKDSLVELRFFHCFVTVTVFSLTNSVSWFSEEFIDECDDEAGPGKELDPKKSGQLLNEEQVQEWDMMIEEEQSPYHANAEILMTKYDHRVL